MPMIILNVNKNNQNSRFLVASLKPQFLPLLLRNLSVSEGVEIILDMEDLLIMDREIGGTSRLRAMITISSLEPQ